jgi:phosphatidylglycerophosphate synthase
MRSSTIGLHRSSKFYVGMLLDPIADKIMVTAALIQLVDH